MFCCNFWVIYCRSLLSRESLASTTLSIAETQSIRSSKLDWPYGYRVLPPLGLGFNQTSEAADPNLIPGTSWSESVSNPMSLYRIISSWRTPAVRGSQPAPKESAVLVSSVRWHRPRPQLHHPNLAHVVGGVHHRFSHFAGFTPHSFSSAVRCLWTPAGHQRQLHPSSQPRQTHHQRQVNPDALW